MITGNTVNKLKNLVTVPEESEWMDWTEQLQRETRRHHRPFGTQSMFVNRTMELYYSTGISLVSAETEQSRFVQEGDVEWEWTV